MAKRFRTKQVFLPPPTEIETEVGGKKYKGSYRVENGNVHVTLPGWGSKDAHLGGMRSEHLADTILGELAIAKIAGDKKAKEKEEKDE